MAKDEIVKSYQEGRITRRELVERLAAAGGALGAALVLTGGGVAGAQGKSTGRKKTTDRKKSTGRKKTTSE